MQTLNKTYSAKKSEIQKKWVLIDATDKVLGRLATEVVKILKGKNKPTYTPSMDCGDNVIIINAEKIKLTGNKMKDKIYYRHTGYMGGLKQTTPEKILAGPAPDKVVRLAVKRMLGYGPMSRKRLSNMYVYAGPNHKHEAQQPEALNV